MDLKMEVYSPFLELLGALEVFNSVVFEDKAFSAGSFSVESLITAKSTELLTPENIIWIEGETAGIIEYVHEETGKSGPYISAKGYLLTGILGRCILWGQYNSTGTAPSIMHRLVEDCCISPTRGNVEARKIPGLVSFPPAPGGDSIRVQKTGGTLLEALEEIGAAFGVAFGVRFDPAIPRMEFWTRWGQNRGTSQTINDPVFYSTELDDVLSSEYFYNAQDWRNVALVAGEGEGADRVMVTVENEVPQPPSPPEPITYTITLSVDPQGGGIVSGGRQVAEGEIVTVAAAPSSGYTFVGWRESGAIVSTSASYTFTVAADRNLTAVFAAAIPVYTITASIDPAGSGTVTGPGQYQEGETVTLSATPADGYDFAGWSENGQTVSTDAAYSFTATSDRAFVAAFEEKPASRLPVGYTEVEYIQNATTSSYIDTGRRFYNSDFTFMFSIPTLAANIRPLYSSGFSLQGYNKTGTLRAWQGSTALLLKPTIVAGQKVTLEGRSSAAGKVYLNGTENAIGPNTSTNIELPYSVSYANQIIRYYYMAGTTTRYSTAQYNFELIPCINPSGTVGFYDIKNNVFIGPKSGSFIAGPTV